MKENDKKIFELKEPESNIIVNNPQKENKDNINRRSLKSIEDFKKRRIEQNIFLHKLFLIFCIIIIIIQIIFLIAFNIKISSVKSKTSSYSHKIDINQIENSNLRFLIDHKLVNIVTQTKHGEFVFTYAFTNETQLEMVKQFIHDFYSKNKNIEINISNITLNILYQNLIDGESLFNFIDKVIFQDKILVVVETLEGYMFGIYIDEMIDYEPKKGFKSKNNDVFIFSYQSKKMYEYFGNEYKNGTAVSFSYPKMICLGDEELIIFNEFFNFGGYINFPMKSFGMEEEIENPFTENVGRFEIKNMEVLSFSWD